MENNWHEEERELSNDDGQEVHFVGENSFSSPRDSVDTRGLMTYIQGLEERLPALVVQQQMVNNAEEPFLRVAQSQDIITGTQIFPGYVFGTITVLTQLTVDTLKYDTNCIMSPEVGHVVELLGVCPALVLWPLADYKQWQDLEKTTKNSTYQGEIKVITFNELLF